VKKSISDVYKLILKSEEKRISDSCLQMAKSDSYRLLLVSIIIICVGVSVNVCIVGALLVAYERLVRQVVVFGVDWLPSGFCHCSPS
jgi:hypothetical protein